MVLDYLSGSPTETVLAAIVSSRTADAPVRYVIAGTSAHPSTTVATSVLGSTPINLMGSGIGAVRAPDLRQAAADILQIAGDVQLQIDLGERSLTDVADAWSADSDRRRIVLTV